jgi:hypothetical protein
MGKVLSWLTQKLGIKSEHQQYKQQVMCETANVDFSAITHDWEKSKRLYDILKKKCHPDLYSGEQNEKATRLFQILMEKKYNYSELLIIKELAEKELAITIS